MNHCQTSNELGLQELTKLNEDSCTRNIDDKTRTRICDYYINNYQYCPSVPVNVQETSLKYPSILHKDGLGCTEILLISKVQNLKQIVN